MKRKNIKGQGKKITRGKLFYYLLSTVSLVLIIVMLGLILNSCAERRKEEDKSDFSLQSSAGAVTSASDSSSKTPDASESPVLSDASSDISVSSSESSPSSSREEVSEPMPTNPPVELGGLSSKRDGWGYYASPGDGAPARITDIRERHVQHLGAIWQGDTSKNKIYITMDIGYEHKGNTAKILDIAKEKNVKLNFFVVGSLYPMPEYKELLLRLDREGHFVASHSWRHDDFTKLYESGGAAALIEDLKKVEDAYHELTGLTMPKYFRFPSGVYSEVVIDVIHKAGYKSVFWSFHYLDWDRDAQPDPKESLDKMVNTLHNGSVLLLHPISDTNAAIFSDFVDILREKGYEPAFLTDFDYLFEN